MPQTYTPQECHEFISSITITDILAGQESKFTVKTDYGGDREFTYTEFKATRQSDQYWSFTDKLTETEIHFHAIEAAQLRRFIFSYPAEFLDLLILPTVFSEIQTELLSVLPGEAAKTWFIFGMQNEKYKWRIHVCERPRPENIDVQYTFGLGRNFQSTFLKRSYEELLNLLADDFPLFDKSCASNKTLAVRVSDTERWFIKYPLSVFSSYADYSFRQYKNVEYIITGKSFSKYHSEIEVINSELQNIELLLSRTVIIFNVYKHWKEDVIKNVRQSIDALVELLGLLKDISFGEKKTTLRWYINPPGETIISLLKNKNISYIFADFESGKGKWELGAFEPNSWDGSINSRPVNKPNTYFELKSLDFELTHIRLMRVFHCYSAFKPERQMENPGDETMIVRQLLNLGVTRVEGGITKESVYDFLESVKNLLLVPQIKMILQLMCLKNGKSLTDLLQNFNHSDQSVNSPANQTFKGGQ
jgi:hypothetical protein